MVDINEMDPYDFVEIDGKYIYFTSNDDYIEYIRIKKINKINKRINNGI